MHRQHQWWTHHDHNTKNPSTLNATDHKTICSSWAGKRFIMITIRPCLVSNQESWKWLPGISAANQHQTYALKIGTAYMFILNWLQRESATRYCLHEALCLKCAWTHFAANSRVTRMLMMLELCVHFAADSSVNELQWRSKPCSRSKGQSMECIMFCIATAGETGLLI